MVIRWSSSVAINVNDPGLPFIGRGFHASDAAQQGGQPPIMWSVNYAFHEIKRLGYKQTINKFMRNWGDVLVRMHSLTVDRDVIWNPGDHRVRCTDSQVEDDLVLLRNLIARSGIGMHYARKRRFTNPFCEKRFTQ